MKQKPIIILGAGGHAKVIIETLRLSNREIIGCVTPDLDTGSTFSGFTVLGDDTAIYNYSADEIELVNGIGTLPRQNLRWNLAMKMRDKGYQFTKVIHPSAIIANDVVLADGVQVMAGVVIQPGTLVGKDTIINTAVIIDHDCTFAENCHLAPGVVCSGGISVGKNVHIGTGTKIIQGINIGKESIIAASSTIYKNVPSGVLIRQQLSTVIEEIGL
jgi:sugar O-acyltransferase (sialic acid O-acetyltransferase NeuD family)